MKLPATNSVLYRTCAALLMLAVVGVVPMALAQQQNTNFVPSRAKGISMHMLPKGVAEMGSMQWGLVVAHAGDTQVKANSVVFQTTADFLLFYHAQSQQVRDNGAWIVVTNPDAYSDEEKQFLEDIKTLCRKEKIPLFISRAAELPTGWKRYN